MASLAGREILKSEVRGSIPAFIPRQKQKKGNISCSSTWVLYILALGLRQGPREVPFFCVGGFDLAWRATDWCVFFCRIAQKLAGM